MSKFIYKQVFLLFLTFFCISVNQAQTTLTGNCNSISLKYPEVYTVFSTVPCTTKPPPNHQPCCRYTNLDSIEVLPTDITIERKGSSGIFVAIGSTSFTNLLPGTYRVSGKFPIKAKNTTCETITINTVNQSKILGTLSGVVQTTNEVVVGGTVPGQIHYSYIDNTNGMFNGWDVNESMKINTSNSNNYDRWWLAIIEQGGANRYKSQGWTFGVMPSEIDLKQFWAKNDPNWQFQQGVYYYIQLAAANSCNSSWVEATTASYNNTFFVCGNNWGCRTTSKYENMIVSPNPATNVFRISNLENPTDYKLTLTDLSGRIVKSYSNIANEELDISDLSTGMYLAHLWNGYVKVQTTKLSIVK